MSYCRGEIYIILSGSNKSKYGEIQCLSSDCDFIKPVNFKKEGHDVAHEHMAHHIKKFMNEGEFDKAHLLEYQLIHDCLIRNKWIGKIYNNLINKIYEKYNLDD